MKNKNPYKKAVPRLSWKINPKTKIKLSKKKSGKESEEFDICFLNKTEYCTECGECEE